MKRMIKASEQSEYRVVSIGLDVVVPADWDGDATASFIEESLNERDNQIRVAAADFKGDLTDLYESDYPADLYI